MDGKTLKGAWEEVGTGAGKVRLFSALTHAEGVVVGQRKIPDNTGEQAQMIPLLDQAQVRNPTVWHRVTCRGSWSPRTRCTSTGTMSNKFWNETGSTSSP